MRVKLVKVLCEVDNNNSKTSLCEYHRMEALILPPQLNTLIILDAGHFTIDGICQDLLNDQIILFDNIDISYQHNHLGELFKKLNSKLVTEGWQTVNFRAEYGHR